MPSKKEKFLFDTTVYYHLLEYGDDFRVFIENEFIKNGKAYTLHLVHLEIRIGLIRSFIQYYKDVAHIREPHKVNTIIRRGSVNNRNLQRLSILVDTILPAEESVTYNSDTNKYLAQIEVAIAGTATKINRLIHRIRGDFSDHDLLRFDLLDHSQYDEYLAICEKTGNKLPLNVFFRTHFRKLEWLDKKIQNADRTILTADEIEYIEKVTEKIGKVLSDPDNAMKKGTYSKMGDLAILLHVSALSHLGRMTIVSNDMSYKAMNKVINGKTFDYSPKLKEIVDTWVGSA